MPNIIATRQRTVPWVGIGVSGRWDNSADALHDSQLDFDVRQEQLFWQLDDEGIVYNEKAPMFGNVRNTDDKLLGCVTPQYRIIQNRDAFSLIDPFIANGGFITHAGMTEDGLCFMVAEVQSKSIGGEDYTINLMATNSFNTRYPCQIIMTPVRIICQNMYRKLVPDRIFAAKHTTTVNERLKAIANGNAIEKKVLAFTNVIESAQGKTMSSRKLELLTALLFPYPKEKGPREATFKLKADEQRRKFLDVYYDAADNQCHHNTAFGFINAYYDYLSHRDAVRNTSMAWADRRLSGIVSGDDVMVNVLKEAM